MKETIIPYRDFASDLTWLSDFFDLTKKLLTERFLVVKTE